jgi:FAD/FMN-containing dehydrogenase
MFTYAPMTAGQTGYEQLRSGFNLAIDHRPAVVIDAANTGDVIAAVRKAAAESRAVAIMNTGHGPSVAADDAVLIRIGRMGGVRVDPVAQTAIVEAGCTWGAVIEAAARHGLAPLNGSSPAVGAVGYTLGGGIGLLGRRFGFAADHVRWLDVVTADGRLRRVTADGPDADLFWAMRGAGPNFGVVTAMAIDLFPVTRLYGGEICFASDADGTILDAYVAWARLQPEQMASSLLILKYPDDPLVPKPLRGRHVTHVRVAYSGDDVDAATRRLQQLRDVGPALTDNLRVMPYSDVGTIHHEPTDEPVSAFDRHLLLRDLDADATATIARHAGPSAAASFVVELRAWGGALSRPPDVPNAVGCRDTAFSLLGISDASLANRLARDAMLAAMAGWATGKSYPNFCGVEDAADAVGRWHSPAGLSRLRRIKDVYDPENLFRVNHNIAATPAPAPALS